MSAATDRLKDPVERTALLATYVAGMCSAAESAEIELAAQHDDVLAHELALMISISQQLKNQADVASPGEFGWSRLKRDIDKDLSAEKQATAMPNSWPWNKIAAIAAGVLVVVQLTFWLDIGQDGYRTLSNPEPPTGVVVQLRFQPDATHSQSQTLLREIDAEVISGPSAASLYRIRLDLDEQDEKAIERVLTRLRQSTAVVKYAGKEG